MDATDAQARPVGTPKARSDKVGTPPQGFEEALFGRVPAEDLAPYPAIRAYVGRLEARPAFRKATEPAAFGPG